MNKESRWLAVMAVAVLLLGLAVKFTWDRVSPIQPGRHGALVGAPANPAPPAADAVVTTEGNSGGAAPGVRRPEAGSPNRPEAIESPLPAADPAPVEPASRFRVSLDSESVHFNEAVVLLNTPDGYRSFLEHAGVNATGKIPEILAVRVRAATVRDIDAMIDSAFPQPELEIFNADLNWKMTLANALSPVGPPTGHFKDVRYILSIHHDVLQPPWLGEDAWKHGNTAWGAGLSLALLDTGVALNIAPLRGRVFPLDVGWGVEPDDRQGTALATVAAGGFDLARGYQGVVPAARILGVRVTAGDGFSDVFTVAAGIVAAAQAGAKVIAVSPTSPYPALVLARAVAFVTADPGVAVVTARPEDLRPSWPALTPGVFPVTAIDDLEAPLGADGSVLRIVRAPTVIVPSVPGPNLDALWVRLDAGPASATTMAAAMTAVLSLFPASTANQIWTALHQRAVDAAFALRPEGEGFRILSLSSFGSASDTNGENTAAAGGASAVPVSANPATPPPVSGFIPGTAALDPSTGRPRVTVIRTGPPAGSTRGGTTPAGRAAGRAAGRGGAGATGAAGN